MAGVKDILTANANKNFVQRIIRPRSFPVIKNQDGTVSTHRMAANSVEFSDGVKEIVYPTIIMRDGGLVQLEDSDAMKYALETGEFIAFDDPTEAREFAAGKYKEDSELTRLDGVLEPQ